MKNEKINMKQKRKRKHKKKTPKFTSAPSIVLHHRRLVEILLVLIQVLAPVHRAELEDPVSAPAGAGAGAGGGRSSMDDGCFAGGLGG